MEQHVSQGPPVPTQPGGPGTAAAVAGLWWQTLRASQPALRACTQALARAADLREATHAMLEQVGPGWVRGTVVGPRRVL